MTDSVDCPHCGKEIKDVDQSDDGDYGHNRHGHYLTVECEHCGREVNVNIEWNPHYYIADENP